MSSIIVKMKSGDVRKFPHEGSPGGSYTKALSFDGAFAVIKDELIELRLSVREWKARDALLDSAKWVSSPGGSVTWLEIDIERAARRERWKRASERVLAIRALRSFLQ